MRVIYVERQRTTNRADSDEQVQVQAKEDQRFETTTYRMICRVETVMGLLWRPTEKKRNTKRTNGVSVAVSAQQRSPCVPIRSMDPE